MIARPRRYISWRWKWLLTPFFRYSATRDAYVLRLGGSRFRLGPVIRFFYP